MKKSEEEEEDGIIISFEIFFLDWNEGKIP
jgi:hypothetical protein